MSATTLAAGWAVVAFAAAQARLRPRHGGSSTPGDALRALGRSVRRTGILRWADAIDATDDPALGATVLGSALLVIVQPIMSIALLVSGPLVVVHRARRRGHVPVVDALDLAPLLDLLIVATTAGLGTDAAVRALVGRVEAPFGDAVVRAATSLDAGAPTTTAVSLMLEPAGRHGRQVASAISDASRDGTSIAATLTRASAELALLGRRQAEQRARRLPVQLIFPLVSCILPAFALLTVVPLLAGSIGSLPI